MSFLTPLFLLLGLLAGPIILMYMLRLRRQEMMVSSTMLWQKLLRDREANAPWQRLKRNLLLLLQLLILAALVLAMARPFLPVPSVVSGSVVVLLDGSASMATTDIEPNRFVAAQEEVEQLIGDLGGDDQMTLILVGQQPQVLASASNDRSALREALAGAAVQPTAADWTAAFALATGAAQGFEEARIIVVSDGGLPADLPPLPAEAVYIPVGVSAENLAISALATRPTEEGPQLFASVTNYGILPQQALLTLSLDGTLFDSRRINVPAQDRINITWDLPSETTAVQAALAEATDDNLALDNQAWAVHAGGISNRALLLTEGNRFLETVFSVLPGLNAFRGDPTVDPFGEGAQSFDLYVFDGVPVPVPPPPADILVIDPQPNEGGADEEGDPLFTVSGVFSNTSVIRLADSSLLEFVDWSNIHVRRAKALNAPWAQPLVISEEGPLLLIGERDGYRVAVLPFRLQESDLPLQIAFPVLMANITSWLSPGQAFDAPPSGLQVGDLVNMTPGAGTTIIVVEKPDGSLWRQEVGEEALVFAETEQLGIYDVRLRDVSGDRPAGSFAVNLFAAEESTILPASTLQFGQTTVETSAEEDVGQQELWPWLAGLALLILLIEWWVYHRGARLPRLTAVQGQKLLNRRRI